MPRVDLLVDLDDLARSALAEAAQANWVDAYLLGAGAFQVCEGLYARSGVTELSVLRNRAARDGARRARWLDALWDGREHLQSVRCRAGAARHLDRLTTELAALVVELADRVLEPGSSPDDGADRLLARLEWVASTVARLPATHRRTVGKLPSSFRSFDQRPGDVVALVERLLAAEGSAGPYCVVGVRTSGAYLAPLAVAALERRAVEHVGLITARPGCHLNRYARSTLASLAPGGRVVVVDDPPSSGASLAAVVRSLRRFVPEVDRFTLLLALTTDGGSVPAELEPYRRVVLPWGEWAIHGELSTSAVARLLGTTLDGEIEGLDAGTTDEGSRRAHLRRTFTARVRRADGTVDERAIEARGVGLGYLGADAVEVAARLGDAVPAVITRAGGVLVSEALADADPSSVTPAVVADYLARRRQHLAVARDRSVGDEVPHSVVGVGATLLARSLGPRANLLLSARYAGRLRRLLASREPVVVDGAMRRAHFGARAGRPVKRQYADGAFSSHDLACYDLGYDVASAALEGDAAYAADVRERCAGVLATAVDDDRWLLYTLVALWDRARTGELVAHEYARRRSDAVCEYLARAYLDDVTAPEDGPIVALDLDGVLETNTGGFSAPGRLGALCLRALAVHGYRVVIATGRSVPEVVARVDRLGLLGGVAEYGAAVYVRSRGVVATLDDADRAALGTARARIAALDGFELNPLFEHSVRCAHITRGGRLTDPEREALAGALDGLEGRLTVIGGRNQVDVVARSVTKETGMRAVLSTVSPEGSRVRAAVGDTAPDRPLLEMAERAYAPGNADRSLRAGRVTALRPRFQAGVAEAVAREIGHRPGACAACRPVPADATRRLLLDALSLDEAGRGPGYRRLARLALTGRGRAG